MFVVALCPLAKLFVQELYLAELRNEKEVSEGKKSAPKYKVDMYGNPVWSKTITTKKMLLEDLSLVESDIPFQVSFKSPVHGEVKFTYGVPTFVNETFFPRMRAEDRKSFLDFLTGGPSGGDSSETNYTGIVQLTYTPEEFALINYAAMSGMPLPEKMKQRQKEVFEIAKETSHRRVMDHIRKLFGHTRDQVNKNRQNKLGAPDLGEIEYLIAYVLRDTEVKEAQKNAEHQKVFESMV